MKNISKLSILVLMLVFASCKDAKTEATSETTAIENSDNTAEGQLYSCPMHPEVTGKQGEECSKCGMKLTELVTNKEVEKIMEVEIIKSESSFSMDLILDDYLKLKNALTNDDSKLASEAGKDLQATLQKVKTDKIEVELQKQYVSIADAAKQHAALISENGGKIDSQRKDFALLSAEMHNLIKMFKTDKKLYQDYCPMYDQGKSGYWISEIKGIQNPYYGSEMLTCGGIVKEL
jgi:hypothetical protein